MALAASPTSSAPLGTDAPWGALPRLGKKAHAFVPEQIAQALRAEISEGRIPPGTKLPEVLLSNSMEVSRHTIRAAFQLLEEDGVAKREPNRGVFVVSPGPDELEEIYRIRRIVEPGVIRTTTLTTPALDALEALAEQPEDADLASLARANQEFHRLLVAQAGSAQLSRTMDRVLAQMRLAFALHDISLYREFRVRHVAIVQLIRRGEIEAAARAMDDYLRDSHERSISVISAGHTADGPSDDAAASHPAPTVPHPA